MQHFFSVHHVTPAASPLISSFSLSATALVARVSPTRVAATKNSAAWSGAHVLLDRRSKILVGGESGQVDHPGSLVRGEPVKNSLNYCCLALFHWSILILKGKDTAELTCGRHANRREAFDLYLLCSFSIIFPVPFSSLPMGWGPSHAGRLRVWSGTCLLLSCGPSACCPQG